MVFTVIAGMLMSLLQQPPKNMVVTPNEEYLVERPADTSVWNLSNEELISHLPLARSEQFELAPFRDVQTDVYVAEFQWRLEHRMVSHEDFGAALRKIQVIRSSPEWNKDTEYHVWFRLPTWLEGVEATAVANTENAKKIRAYYIGGGGCGNALMGQEEEETYQAAGFLCEGTSQVVFQLTVEDLHSRGSRVIWTGNIVLPVQLVENSEYEPTDTQATNALVESTLRVEVEWPESTSAVPLFYFYRNYGNSWAALPDDTVIEREIALYKGSTEVVKQTVSDPRELRVSERWNQYATAEYFFETLNITDANLYTIRVRGVKPAKPSRWCKTKYWAGEYTMPLRKSVLTDEEISRLP